MSLASNPLLQITPASPGPVTGVSSTSKVAEQSHEPGASFAELYAKHNQQQTTKADAATNQAQARQSAGDRRAQARANARDDATAARQSAAADKSRSVDDKPKAAPDKPAAVADKPAVADSGKPLPAQSTAAQAPAEGLGADASTLATAGLPLSGAELSATEAVEQGVATEATSLLTQAQGAVVEDMDQPLQATEEDEDQDPSDPDATLVASLDPAGVDPLALPVITPDPALNAPTDPAAMSLDPSVVASLMPTAITSAPVPVSEQRAPANDIDPAPDALADLPAVRLALEQNAKAQGTTSTHAQATPDPDTATDGSAVFVNGLAAQMAAQQSSGAGTGLGTGEKDFDALLEGGLKDAKDASADTRVDNFANRLQSLSDATSVKSSTATPLTTPLPMSQSGWSEGLVNRVMYLSSQNLKSADIQLSPAELGTLNIRVDMAPDQQTQVTFVSAHIGVREALESQQARLKEMFAQQGLGQMDVNVSDQSRNPQGQQPQAQQTGRAGGHGGGAGDSGEFGDRAANVAEVIPASSLIGTSAVDYYA
jgi:flagellar hook-length control protein FliK